MRASIIRRILSGLRRTVAAASPQRDSGEFLPSGLSAAIRDDEHLARFLKHEKQYSKQKSIVKPAAFLPDSKGFTSVFRHNGEPASELWAIGSRELGAAVNIRGAGILRASEVRSQGLEAAASEPPPRHANIERWPTHDDPELAKAAQKEKALALASLARLLLRPE